MSWKTLENYLFRMFQPNVRQTSLAKVKEWSNEVKPIVILRHLSSSQNPRGECSLDFSRVLKYWESIYERTWNVISSTMSWNTRREKKANYSVLVENHTKCIGLRPTRLFSAYQTICASDLFPLQRNLEVVCSSCLRHANKMLLGDHDPWQADQRTQSFHFSIFIHQSLDPADRPLKPQAPCLYNALEHSTGSERVDA